MKLSATLPLAVAAALGAGLYAAALLSDTAQAESRSAVVLHFPSAAGSASVEHVTPTPRECQRESGIETDCIH